MTPKQLHHANKLHGEIEKLERFISDAERKWTGRLIHKTNSFVFFMPAYGALESTSLELDTELKNKVLQVLRLELAAKKEELDNL